jgi:CheY-like chemotaxis protein
MEELVGSGGTPEQENTALAQPAAPLVLVVDDNETNRTTIVDFLSARKYRVAAAGSAAEFFEKLSGEVPALILMDIQMPEMDGLEAIRRVRAHPNPQAAGVPIIALTALAMPDDREKCIAAGANEYLSKPVGLRNLAALIQSIVEKRSE